jgi:hypothetical protein
VQTSDCRLNPPINLQSAICNLQSAICNLKSHGGVDAGD